LSEPGSTSITLGVLADTHIPDRRAELDPRILPMLRERRVHRILHAGDVSAPEVLAELEAVAPVQAVRGNRDWLWLRSLPDRRVIKIGDVTIGMAHGHGGWLSYLSDQPVFLLRGYYHERLLPRLRSFRFLRCRLGSEAKRRDLWDFGLPIV
jgi:hypothetical protein